MSQRTKSDAVLRDDLLRIGELASQAGVSRRTVDFYTGLGLLTPASRSGGNFRLYQPTDIQRIAAIRQLEGQGIRLDEITHLLTDRALDDHTQCVDHSDGPCPADPMALEGYLTSLDAQVRALRGLPDVAEHGTRGAVLATLVARAQMLIATALLLSEDLLPGTDFLPPL
jgi:MerR family copper efflux transcriptional regulator